MNKCAKAVRGRRSLVSWRCGRTARVEHDGRWYCGTHDPEKEKSRRERYNAAFDAETAERRIMRDAEDKIEKLGRKVPAIRMLYDIVDAARERLHKVIETRRRSR